MSRSKWKGPYVDPKNLKKINLTKKQHKTLIITRNSEIIPTFLGLTFTIHNGKNYVKIIITEDMIGHKFGEFSMTRGKFSYKKKKKKSKK